MSFETTITHNIMKYLNDMPYVIAEKVKGEAECSGRADINGCFRGHSMRIEVKTPDNRNKPSKKQLWNLWQWNNAGAICIVTYSLEFIKQELRDELSITEFFMPTGGYNVYKEANNCKSLILYPYSRVSFKEIYNIYYKGEIEVDTGD